jgi:hypothetical protein
VPLLKCTYSFTLFCRSTSTICTVAKNCSTRINQNFLAKKKEAGVKGQTCFGGSGVGTGRGSARASRGGEEGGGRRVAVNGGRRRRRRAPPWAENWGWRETRQREGERSLASEENYWWWRLDAGMQRLRQLSRARMDDACPRSIARPVHPRGRLLRTFCFRCSAPIDRLLSGASAPALIHRE